MTTKQMGKILALIAASLLSTYICIPSKADDAKEFEYARRLTNAGHYLEATKVYRDLQRRRPGNVDVLVELGFSYERNFNDPSGLINARKCFERALQMDPEKGSAYLGLALCADGKGEFEKGIQYATKAINAKKPEVEGYRERAGALSHLRRDKEALQDIDVYLKRTHSKSSEDLLLKASILENLKRFDLALLEYRLLLKTHWEDSLVYREVACLQALHKTDEAVLCINNLIKQNKQDDSSYLCRARIYESMGKHKEAIADYSKAYDLLPSTTALKERASVYDRIGRKDLADKDRKDAERI